MEFELEIIGTTIEGCLLAEKAGATRIELCGSLCDGGTTPPFSLIKAAVTKLRIPVYVMIRPRGGDFFYSDEEFALMKEDIQVCRKLGVQGIVTGILLKDGTVDKERNQKLVELAYPMGATFHRAFDRAADPHFAIMDIIDLGFERILTSGQKPTALEGMTLLKDLVEKHGDDIIIMPGSGITDENILEIANQTKAKEFHLSGRSSLSTQMEYVNPDMNETLSNPAVDVKLIQSIASKLKSL